MISITTDSVRLGDTLRLSWQLPSGSRILTGPAANDSLALQADSAHPGQWILQPLSTGAHGGDTLRAIGPAGDTIVETMPSWNTAPALPPQDSSISTMIGPRDVPVPFPWKDVGIGLGIAALVALAVWAWMRHRARRPPPPPPPTPVVPPHDRIRDLLDALEASSRAGMPAREVAFRAGEILRELHAETMEWKDATDATSREWRLALEAKLPQTTWALEAFLAEADPLRYADDVRDATELLRRARQVLDATPTRTP